MDTEEIPSPNRQIPQVLLIKFTRESVNVAEATSTIDNLIPAIELSFICGDSDIRICCGDNPSMSCIFYPVQVNG